MVPVVPDSDDFAPLFALADFDDLAAYFAWCFGDAVEPVSEPVAALSEPAEPDEPLADDFDDFADFFLWCFFALVVPVVPDLSEAVEPVPGVAVWSDAEPDPDPMLLPEP